MNNIKEDVCINRFPKYNTTSDCWEGPYKISENTGRLNLSQDLIKNKNEDIESALEEYLLFKYNVSKERLERVASSMHNFKLKGFECVTTNSTMLLHGETLYLDKGVGFLRVSENTFGYRVYKLWEKNMKTLNIVSPTKYFSAWNLLMDCISRDFGYTQTKATLCTLGYYLPQDQWWALKVATETQRNLNIGDRSEELAQGYGDFMSLNDQEWEKGNINSNCTTYWSVLRGDHNIIENDKGEFHENRILDSYIGCRDDATFLSGEEILAKTHDLFIPEKFKCDEMAYRISKIREGSDYEKC